MLKEMEICMSWSIIICVICFCMFFVWWLKRPYWYKNVRRKDFEKKIRLLVNQLGDGGIIIIRHRGTKRFVQFVQYAKKNGIQLNFGYPMASWSEAYFDEMRIKLDEAGFSPVVVETGNREVPKFIEVNWDSVEESNFAQAAEVAMLVFDVMGIGADDVFEVNYSGSRDKNYEDSLLHSVCDDNSSRSWVKGLASRLLEKK